jgi:hypothetical protein
MFIDFEDLSDDETMILVDSDGFKFRVSSEWDQFVPDFVRGYEERNIDPMLSIMVYWQWRGSQEGDMRNILRFIKEPYKSKIQRLMLLV